jgi:S-formylglutathione hydrolase FrmB
MRIDSPTVVGIGAALVVVTAALLAVVWDAGRGGWRVLLRATVLTACLLGVAATSALQVNRMTEMYPTWAALVGAPEARPAGGQPPNSHLDGSGAGPGATQLAGMGPSGSGKAGHRHPPTRKITVRLPPPAGSHAGTIVPISVTGRASGLTLPVYVYLPAAYQQPADQHTAFPVIEALHGYPGSPRSWLDKLHVQRYLDQEMATGRMPPTVVLFPRQTTSALLDTECTNLAHGPKTDTFLTTDVPAAVAARFRVRTDREGWALTGYSAGAFCAINLVLRHPDRYIAAASLSGYAAPGITIGDGSERTTNNPAWRLRHFPQPPIGLYLAYANDDSSSRQQSQLLAELAGSPMSVTTATIPYGGHSGGAWETMEGPAFDWLASWLARPIPVHDAMTPGQLGR